MGSPSYDEFPRSVLAAGSTNTLPLEPLYGTFTVADHPDIFAFGVLTTLFSFGSWLVYALLLSAFTVGASVRPASRRRSASRLSGTALAHPVSDQEER